MALLRLSQVPLWASIRTGGFMSDLLYLAGGIVIFVIFAGYAVLLRRA
jgi:hypothetical protein